MFSVQYGGTRWSMGVPFLLLLTLLLTVDKSGTALLCLLASFLHEGGHIAALLAMGRPPCEVAVGACGIRLVPHPRPLSSARRAVVLLTGPLVNLTLAALLQSLHCAAAAVTAHAVLGTFNLLPIEALDGGQLLACFLPVRAVRWISVAVLLPLATLGFCLLFWYGNPSLLLVSAYLVVRLFSHERI